MSEEKDFFYLGRIIRAKGLKGDLIAFFDADDPQRYSDLHGVFIRTRQGFIPYIIESIDIDEKGWTLLKFLHVDDRTSAMKFVKKELYLPLSMLPDLPDNEFYYHEIIGFQVYDIRYGDIGQVSGILQHTVQPILQVSFKDKEILIPLNTSIIQRVDKKARMIEVQTPDGLIDLYLS